MTTTAAGSPIRAVIFCWRYSSVSFGSVKISTLRRKGASGSVTAQTVEYVFETEDPLVATFEKLVKA